MPFKINLSPQPAENVLKYALRRLMFTPVNPTFLSAGGQARDEVVASDQLRPVSSWK
ncbi:MAG: hypothetical protein IH627_01300 [Rubrivivax sp.]|nr:hypothetical protein [Rubrivivax sp.]